VTEPSPCIRLRRALLGMLDGATCTQSRHNDWHSALFSGLQLSLTIRLEGANANGRLRAFLKSLPEAEFDIPGYVVADIIGSEIARDGKAVVAKIDALLIEDPA